MMRTKPKVKESLVGDDFRFPLKPKANKARRLFAVFYPVSFLGIGFSAGGINSFDSPNMVIVSWIVGIVTLVAIVVVSTFVNSVVKKEKAYVELNENRIHLLVEESIARYKIDDYKSWKLYVSYSQNGKFSEVSDISYYENVCNFSTTKRFGAYKDVIYMFDSEGKAVMPVS